MIDREKIKRENAAYNALITAGYLPQGRNSKGKCVVKIPDNRGGWMYGAFDSWQTAVYFLIVE